MDMPGHTQLATAVFHAIFLLLLSLCKNVIHCFCPDVLMIKETHNLIESEHILVYELKFCVLN